MKPNQAGKKPLLLTCFKLLIFVFMLASVLANFGFFLTRLAEAAITLDPNNPANINSEANLLFTAATPQRGVDKAGLRHDTFSSTGTQREQFRPVSPGRPLVFLAAASSLPLRREAALCSSSPRERAVTISL